LISNVRFLNFTSFHKTIIPVDLHYFATRVKGFNLHRFLNELKNG
jgi:hypothetical protein